MPIAKQAKLLTYAQQRACLNHVGTSRYPARDRAILLLSFKAGLRAKEIAFITWGMVTDAEGVVSDVLHLENSASKGSRGGRQIPMHPELRESLIALRSADRDNHVVFSERGRCMSPTAVANWFYCLYKVLGFTGASSHSGRRTFITRAARNIVQAGGSLRDVQDLAGHSSLTTTQRYIEVSDSAKSRVVNII